MDLNRAPSNSSQEGKDEKKVSPRFPEEEEEDILRETSDRFVLFPIKYREVRLQTYLLPH